MIPLNALGTYLTFEPIEMNDGRRTAEAKRKKKKTQNEHIRKLLGSWAVNERKWNKNESLIHKLENRLNLIDVLWTKTR